MNTIILEIALILLLVVANGLFAMAEMAVVVARKARLRELAEAGDPRARAALDLATSPDRFLSTVQIGITLVGILAGAFGGASIAEKIADGLEMVPGLAPYGEAIGLVVVVLGITFLSLVIGELLPKRIALNSPERVAMIMARPMRALSRVASPFVSLLSVSTDAAAGVLRIRPSAEPSVTEEEIKVLVREAASTGVLEEREQELVESIFRFGDRTVSALMTPRHAIVWLDVRDDDRHNCEVIAATRYSRYIVGDDSIDSVIGVVIAKEFLAARLGDPTATLSAYAREPLFVPATASALGTLERFRGAPMHLAVIVDEHGSTVGLLTSNDILEAIVGELTPPTGDIEPDAVEREDGSWLIDGAMLFDDFRRRFAPGVHDDEHHGEYMTLAGFIMTKLGRVPATADHLLWEGLRLEIVDMDGKRIDRVLLSRVEPGAKS